ncbi:DUF4254 domain-containing protein [Nocardia panacis]|uniref:DUF4254 domain-containing protein n=1 Tax=Nocardia panacis TaxID=2340916 RepID=A0A3A4KNX5_9NOCA|nr:DUF4254 domain-containing protein [Nocardia panacis]RJO74820.1 DUF4254 domain-containing protein [Nocardia panacis]
MTYPETTHRANDRILPRKELLLLACRGLPHDDHPMLEAAGELAQLHEIRERTPAGQMDKLERRRGQLIRSIDLWVTVATPAPVYGARAHTETVGQLVDRLARLTAQAFIPLACAPDPVFYDAWVCLAEQADAYQDLVDDLRCGARKLPVRSRHW